MRVLMWNDFHRVSVERPGNSVTVEISRTLLDKHPELESYVGQIVLKTPGAWPRNILLTAEGETVYLPATCCLDPKSETREISDFVARLMPILASEDSQALSPLVWKLAYVFITA